MREFELAKVSIIYFSGTHLQIDISAMQNTYNLWLFNVLLIIILFKLVSLVFFLFKALIFVFCMLMRL